MAAFEAELALGEMTSRLPTFEEAGIVGLSVPIFLASTGKAVPKTKKQIL